MSTLACAWVTSTGSVRFTVTGATAGQTVKRVTPGDTLQAIRGYGDDTWISAGSGFGYDYEMELGVTVRYALVDMAATTLPPGWETATPATNLAVNPIGPQGNSVNWWAPSRGTLAAELGLLRLTITDATVADNAQRINSPTSGSTRLTVTPGATVRARVQARSAQSFPLHSGIQFLDASSVAIGAIVFGAAATSNPSTFVDLPEMSVVAPANAAFMTYQVGIGGTVARAVGNSFEIRQVLITRGSPSMPYFDGDTADTGEYRYDWTGVAGASTSTQTPLVVVASVFTQTPGRANGEAWLRDILQPILSQPVSVISTGDERRIARQAVYDIVAKPNPVVVWDSRTSRQGTVTLAVQNLPETGVWDNDTNRDKMDRLLSSGRPLLLSMCANLGFHPCYMAVADATYTRVGKGATWALQLDYVEIDNPTALDVYPATEISYGYAQQVPPDAIYADWTPVTYYDIATRSSA